jgi:hypothetical protein
MGHVLSCALAKASVYRGICPMGSLHGFMKGSVLGRLLFCIAILPKASKHCGIHSFSHEGSEKSRHQVRANCCAWFAAARHQVGIYIMVRFEYGFRNLFIPTWRGSGCIHGWFHKWIVVMSCRRIKR